MCTCFAYLSRYGMNYLARTMDFSYEQNERPVAVPRDIDWTSKTGTYISSCYAYIGSGVDVGRWLFADGVNEHGLAVSVNYFSQEATYAPENHPTNTNITSEEVCTWLLGNIRDIDDLKARAHDITIVDYINPAIDRVVPLHYIVTDATGKTVAVEPKDGALIVKDNPVHVLTNNPELEWHLKNLSQHLDFSTTRPGAQQLHDLTVQTHGVEAGTRALPGGFTSADRFARMTYLKAYLEDLEDDDARVNQFFRLLDTVSIPKGVVFDDNETHYTQYQSILNCTTRTLYYKAYESNQVFTLTLTEDLIHADAVQHFPVVPQFEVKSLNN